MTNVLKIKMLVNNDPVILEEMVNDFLMFNHLQTENFVEVSHSCTTERQAQQGQTNGLIHYTALITYRVKL